MTSLHDLTAHPVDADAVVGLLPRRPRLLALGEPTHGEEALLEVRNELFRSLVEEQGYRTIALESDCLKGLLVDDHVTSGAGDLDHVMTSGLSHGLGAAAANRELVRWLRSHNDGRPASEQVHLAGFDGPLEMAGAASPREALTGLHGYLAAALDPGLLPCTPAELAELLGPDGRWSDPAAMADPSRSVGRSPDAARLRLLADDLSALLEAQTPHLVAATSVARWHRARLLARTATGLLRYHAAQADPSPHRLTRLCALRDAMMAANLLALAEQGPVLVHAHNAHLQRDLSSMQMAGHRVEWWSAGALVSTHLGQDYAFLATAVGTIPHRGVDAPPPGTPEGVLHALPQDRFVVDARALAEQLGDAAPRVSPWFGYAPLDPSQLGSTDGVVFLRSSTATYWPS
ncbi:erythromycin esterase [Auraticoccus sp. F435]|uniref:Erythromycin esterase n=1 Tax=Auraticoccus cholistanensis TaxID=2656650 RepID=A0A6A9UP96_9ACTN|nr:erythromycin esterase family protein [Auraticoccus cholistanensis]MVA74696.1 erythromycin esterase [Auraticoccus cholistanensis]